MMSKSSVQKEYNTTIIFGKELIAPCGMNCGSCMGYMRRRNHCHGCRNMSDPVAGHCRKCTIINCEQLKETVSGFCYECRKYPCRRLKSLDKRYRTRYNTSFLDNLAMIKEEGIDRFLLFETARRRCPDCGATLCVHRTACMVCGFSPGVTAEVKIKT
jgi:hypothetical protein